MPPDPTPTIDAHVPCGTCGYDLFGQPRGGLCPECGGWTAASLARSRYAIDLPTARAARDGLLLSILANVGAFACVALLILRAPGRASDLPTAAALCLTAALEFAAADRIVAAGGAAPRAGNAVRSSRRFLIYQSMRAVGTLALTAAILSNPTSGASARMASTCAAAGAALLAVGAVRSRYAFDGLSDVAHATQAEVPRAGYETLRGLKTTAEFTFFGLAAVALAMANRDAGIVLLTTCFAVLASPWVVLLWLAEISIHAVLLRTVRRTIHTLSAAGR